jgi:hypothetical protein
MALNSLQATNRVRTATVTQWPVIAPKFRVLDDRLRANDNMGPAYRAGRNATPRALVRTPGRLA